MKILSLNIQHGGGSIRHAGAARALSLLAWTLGHTPDIVVLSEWRDNTVGQGFLSIFREKGFTTATASRPVSGANGILIAARQAFKSRRITPGDSERGELLVAELSRGFRLLAAYFPISHAKAPFFRLCMTEAARARKVPLLLIGDLNTGRNNLDVEGNGERFHCVDLFESLESQSGLIDLWRATNGTRQEWTWRSRVNGFRIDHAFGNKVLVERFGPIHSHYDHSPREMKITDHSALFVEFSRQDSAR
jgi:exodeoxyribonuclease III